MIDDFHRVRRTDGHADALVERLQQLFPAGRRQPHDADIAAAAAPGFDHVTMVGREARGEHVIDLGRRTLEMLGQLVSAKLDGLLLILLILHERLDKIFNRIAE